MTMHHYHVVLVRVFVLQDLSTQFTVLPGGGIVEGFNVSPATAPCAKFFSTADASPSTTTIQCYDWLTFLIYFTFVSIHPNHTGVISALLSFVLTIVFVTL